MLDKFFVELWLNLSRCANAEIKETAGWLQICAGHAAGAEAALYAMRKVSQEKGTDAILLKFLINTDKTP